MKRLLLFGCLLTSSLVAFAQGKVQLRNDSLHLIYLTTDTSVLFPADIGLAGQAVPVGGVLPSGFTLQADLWAGTSASALALVDSNVSFSSFAEGELNVQNLTLPWSAGTTYFQLAIHDTVAPYALGHYWGETSVFTAVTGATLVYNPLTSTGAPSFSTWALGDFPVDWEGSQGLGAIKVFVPIPEPSTLALAGLGLALLTGCRARTRSTQTHHGVHRSH